MKGFFILGSFSLFIIISCSQKKEKQSEVILPEKKIEKRLSITGIGRLEFDRSYSAGMAINNEKERNKYYKEVKKSNPFLNITPYDSLDLQNKFQNLGFVNGYELTLKKFKYETKKDFEISDEKGKSIQAHFERKDSVAEWKLFVFNKKDTSQIELQPYYIFQLKYALLNIIPGGYPEIVVFIEDYISNNERYIFEVFEIKTKD
jgi:hypothetical protein